jgi:hypothetical protein
MSSGHDLWTFRIRGGRAFACQPEGNPSVVHDGVVSVFHLMLTEAQAKDLTALIESYECEVLDARPTESQSEEQKAERDLLRGVGREDKVWPTAGCPDCFWFDPTLEDDPCGYLMWTVEIIETALDSHKKARLDVQRCSRRLRDIAGLESVDPEG